MTEFISFIFLNHPNIMAFQKIDYKYMVTALLFFLEFPIEDLTVFQLFTPKITKTLHEKNYIYHFLLTKNK